ncbi:hypothetical protein H7J08_12435 [Mycobacterium frederiksbergense]|uniref:hypothetical protein n=2 Tax=Mycolicibacterium frederiksbergense TaxID=117567 RepID=UPI0021F3B4D6|nr:hypothetical protein [Mycolicibacterium frederiksbergense]MCV7045474.1 hypothetical protein [Mycolicibacterium frederiksbergense]
MVFMGVDNRQGARIASVRELAPMFHRPPDRVWAQCYRMECENSPVIDWYGADFAKCPTRTESPVIDALREATAAADRRFVAYLRTVLPTRASDVVTVELISEKSVGADGPFFLPIGPPTQMY